MSQQSDSHQKKNCRLRREFVSCKASSSIKDTPGVKVVTINEQISGVSVGFRATSLMNWHSSRQRMNNICGGEEAIQSATSFTFSVMNRPSSAVYGGVNGVSHLDSGVAGKVFREKRTGKRTSTKSEKKRSKSQDECRESVPAPLTRGIAVSVRKKKSKWQSAAPLT